MQRQIAVDLRRDPDAGFIRESVGEATQHALPVERNSVDVWHRENRLGLR
ncbi:hypothetical protein [Rosistilla oblonga]|nr:hypothetical protein [Rosistilla oblonga]